MFTVSSTLIWAALTGQTDWVCHIGTLTLCVEAVAWSCIIVTWWSGFGVIQAWSWWSTGFLQCFDTVGLVIWPVKIVPENDLLCVEWDIKPYTLTHPPFWWYERWCRPDKKDPPTCRCFCWHFVSFVVGVEKTGVKVLLQPYNKKWHYFNF